MGLTRASSGLNALRESFISLNASSFLIALAGNPNCGKSTVFNALTGLKQHTGNWPGKTVTLARGRYSYRGLDFTLVDLPGTYSLLASSVEEQIARQFICFAHPDVVIVVVDATCLERNLNLVLQVLETTPRVVVCLNLMDEARRKKMLIDVPLLSQELGLPVVPTVARDGEGLEKLKEIVAAIAAGILHPAPKTVRYNQAVEAAVITLEKQLQPLLNGHLNARWVALRLLEGELSIRQELEQHLGLALPQNVIQLKTKKGVSA
ncbi:MAG: iron transporter FeoB [Clostridia bacterium]|nr:iron transporter FeoB [Clostridia bacterium]